MTTYHEISDDSRVKVNQGLTRRVAEYQKKEGDDWKTLCSRPYRIDIRINAVSDIIRVAGQRGLLNVGEV